MQCTYIWWLNTRIITSSITSSKRTGIGWYTINLQMYFYMKKDKIGVKLTDTSTIPTMLLVGALPWIGIGTDGTKGFWYYSRKTIHQLILSIRVSKKWFTLGCCSCPPEINGSCGLNGLRKFWPPINGLLPLLIDRRSKQAFYIQQKETSKTSSFSQHS
jgi:hypothetical protein